MAPRLPLYSAPCLFCRASLQTTKLAIRTQVAYKGTVRNQNRKNSKTDFAIVQLLEPVFAYGDHGSYLRVPRGTMRNELYPRKQARYIVGDELKELKTRDVNLERDRQFRPSVELSSNMTAAQRKEKQDEFAEFAAFMTAEAAKRRQQEEEDAVQREEELKRLAERDADQRRRAQALGRAIPKLPDVVRPSYIFQKSVNTASAQIDKTGDWRAGTPIFGSVTVADILTRLRESLSRDLDTATIALEESNISFVSGADEAEPDRLKTLGAFQVKVAIPGADTSITTTIEVLPDNSSDEALAQAREVARKAGQPTIAKESAASAFAKVEKRKDRGPRRS